MECPSCHFDNPEGMQFCMECGASLGTRCPSCDFENLPRAKFRGKCGARLGEASPSRLIPPKLEDMHAQLQKYIPPSLAEKMHLAEKDLSGENRLVTALFADISGFTALSQSLPTESVVEKVNQCFRLVTDAVYRYEGSINRFIGDCVLAFFGAPLAHENDPERAVRAALEMRGAVSALGLSISVGVNTGMTYFGPIGTERHLEVSAYGPDVNLAKRLEDAAKPGQVLVGAGTHRLTRKTFDNVRLEPLSVKGVAAPISVYEVTGVAERPEKLRGIEGLRARMIGREREFAELKETADQWLSGQGQMVSVIGEAGIGKSRLVAELKGYLERAEEGGRGFRCLEGRCISIGQPISYWPFLDMLRSYFGLSHQDSEAELARKVTIDPARLKPQPGMGSWDAAGFCRFPLRATDFRAVLVVPAQSHFLNFKAISYRQGERMMSRAKIIALSIFLIVLAGCSRARKQEAQPQAQPPAAQQPALLGAASDYGLARADPESLGLSAEKLAAIKTQLNTFVVQGKLPGFVVAVARDGKLAYFEAWGMRDVERAKPMTPDTIFRMYSMTKPITGAAVMVLVGAGKISLDDPVSKYIPEFKDMRVLVEKSDGSTELVPAVRPITLKHLMTHTSGLVYGFMDTGKLGELYRQKNIDPDGYAGTSLEEFAKRVAAMPLKCQPGKEWHYGINMDILGRIVEVVMGRRYADFLQDTIFGPLGMKDAGFYVPAAKADRFAADYGPKGDTGGMTLIDDPVKSRFLKVPSQDKGGAGLVCTAGDYLRFAQMLLNGGELDGVRILSAKAVLEMTSNQLPPELGDSSIHLFPFLPGVSFKGVGFGYCGATPLKDAVNTYYGDEGEYTWGGAASTDFWIDKKEGIVGMVLTQLEPTGTYPTRPMTHNGIKAAIVKSRAALR